MKQPKYSKNNLKAVSTEKAQAQTKIQTNKEVKEQTPKTRKHPRIELAIKVFAILAIVVGVVRYTDEKKYFEPKLTFHERKEASSYVEFTKKDTVDILLLGNSIVGAGINSHMLTCALGANTFSYFTSGADMKDVYFTLKDALHRSSPKIVVVETFAIGDILYKNLPMLKKTMGFRQRTDTLEKFMSMPYLFSLEEFAGAWSYTVRNHDFLFRDTAQITFNKTFKDTVALKNIYLGDSNINLPCITDSTDAIYDSLGANIDGALVRLNEFDAEYIMKTKELCDKNDIKLVFLTLPTYRKNIKNYDIWRKALESVINPTKCPWLDLQANYDSVHYTKRFFENSYKVNLHIVYDGALWISNQFAEFLTDSLGSFIPNRFNEKRWNELFYGSEGYYLSNAPKDNDTTYFNLCKDLDLKKVKIQNAYWFRAEKHNNVIVKFEV